MRVVTIVMVLKYGQESLETRYLPGIAKTTPDPVPVYLISM